jgi:hypothetical protein
MAGRQATNVSKAGSSKDQTAVAVPTFGRALELGLFAGKEKIQLRLTGNVRLVLVLDENTQADDGKYDRPRFTTSQYLLQTRITREQLELTIHRAQTSWPH